MEKHLHGVTEEMDNYVKKVEKTYFLLKKLILTKKFKQYHVEEDMLL